MRHCIEWSEDGKSLSSVILHNDAMALPPYSHNRFMVFSEYTDISNKIVDVTQDPPVLVEKPPLTDEEELQALKARKIWIDAAIAEKELIIGSKNVP